MADTDGLLAEIQSGRATFVAYAELAALLDTTPEKVITAFNDIVNYERGQRILDLCSQQPSLSKPLLERWLTYAHLFEAPRLQSYLCQLVVRLAEEEARYWQQRARETNQRLATAAVKLADLEEIKARHAQLLSRYAQSAEGVAEVEAMVKEIETKEAQLRRLQTFSRPRMEQQHNELRNELQRERQKLETEEKQLREEEHQLRERLAELSRQVNGQRERNQRLKELDELVSFAQRLDNPPQEVRLPANANRYQDLIREMEKLRVLLQGEELKKRIEKVYSDWEEILEGGS